MNIAEKLRKLREERGLSQQQLIDELCKTQGERIAISSVRNYENEKSPRVPQGTILLALSRFYNVSIEYLLDDNIKAKEKENIDISKELGISDKAIDTIKKLNKKFNNAFNIFLSSEEAYFFLYDYFMNMYISIIKTLLFRLYLVDFYINESNKEITGINNNKMLKEYKNKETCLIFLQQIDENMNILNKFVQKFLYDTTDIVISSQFIQLSRNTNLIKLINGCIKKNNEIIQKIELEDKFDIDEDLNILMGLLEEIIDNIRLFNTLSHSICNDDLIEVSSAFLNEDSSKKIIAEIKNINIKEMSDKIKCRDIRWD